MTVNIVNNEVLIFFNTKFEIELYKFDDSADSETVTFRTANIYQNKSSYLIMEN